MLDDDLPHVALKAAEAAATWRPHLSGPYAGLENLPFLAWLVGLQKPRQMIALGIGEGVGYFALCQVTAETGLTADLFGIDNWPDDRGLPRIPEEMQHYNATHYAGCSRLVCADPRSVVNIFDMEEIDLLFVDMDLDTDLIGMLVDSWAPLMQERGVIVLRGSLDPEILTAQPHLRLGEDGPIMLLVGEAVPVELAALAALPADSPAWQAVERRLHEAGTGLRLREEDALARSQRALLSAELEGLRDTHATAEARVAAQDAELAALRRDMAEGLAALATRDAALARQAVRIEELEGERNAAQEAAAARIDEIVTLTRIAEAARITADDLQGQVVTLRGQAEMAAKDRKADLARFEKERKASALRLAEQDAAANALRKQIAEGAAALSERDKALAGQEMRVRVLEQAVAEGLAALATRDATLAGQAVRIEELELERNGAQEAAAARIDEIVTLTRIAEAQRHEGDETHNRAITAETQAAANAERIEKLLSECNLAHSKNKALVTQHKTELAALEQELKTTASRVTEYNALLVKQVERIKDLSKRNLSLAHNWSEERRAHELVKRSLDDMKAEVLSLRTECRSLYNEIDVIRSSTSWRVTVPLRGVRQIVSLRKRNSKNMSSIGS